MGLREKKKIKGNKNRVICSLNAYHGAFGHRCLPYFPHTKYFLSWETLPHLYINFVYGRCFIAKNEMLKI